MFYINETTGMIYTGDLQAGDRALTPQEETELLRDKRSYAEKRSAEYPSLGDMVDAFCKAKQGDESELNALLAQRQAIKNKYPKE